MTTSKAITAFLIIVALIGATLVYVRLISDQFAVGTTTFEHPYILFTALLMIAGTVWTAFMWVIPKLESHGAARRILLVGIVLGIGLRVMFIGSTPIYENDWNRYLWDGAVVAQGINPYTYSPDDVLYTEVPETEDLIQLQRLSEANDEFPYNINYGDLTTIYPPVAQGVFGLAALIKPFDLDVLRLAFLVIDALSIFLLIKTLNAYGRSSLWALLYALNPLLIYAGFNAVHMDIILVPFLLLALIWIKTKPYHAAFALAAAGAVKMWPLILAPVLFRQWRNSKKTYLISAAIVALGFVFLMAPLLHALKPNAGTVAYAGEWSRNAFFFPLIESALGLFLSEPGTSTRLFVAAILTGLSLWIGFRKFDTAKTLPQSLLLVTAALFLLSPTGYPWYAIWLFVFLPFAPSYGLAALTVLLSLYYTRYALVEQDFAELYTSILIPAQFVVPVLILGVEFLMKRKPHAH